MKYRMTRLSIAAALFVAMLACASPGEATPTLSRTATSEPSVAQSPTPTPVIRPPAPENVATGHVFDTNAVVINWEYPWGENVIFEIERAFSENGPWHYVAEVRSSTRDYYLDHGLCSGDRYWHRMFATLNGVRSNASNAASGVAGNVMPGLPTPETCIEGSEDPASGA